jgi:hypothetical protein
MKKTIIAVGVIAFSFVSASVHAQTTWDAKKNPTVDSITAPYEAKLLPARTQATVNDIYPALGSYQSANTDAQSVVVTMDEQSKGVVWIDGLPQGKIKAFLRKSPATYKIPAQKTDDGKDVPEGTLIYDKDANTLNIVIGKSYNSEDPAAAFAMAATDDQSAATSTTDEAVKTETVKTKTKTASGKTVKTKTKVEAPKPWTYTGTKVETTTVMSTQQQ